MENSGVTGRPVLHSDVVLLGKCDIKINKSFIKDWIRLSIDQWRRDLEVAGASDDAPQ